MGNVRPTAKFDIQFMNVATDMAAGLVPCVNNSAVIMNGIDPGPTPKNRV